MSPAEFLEEVSKIYEQREEEVARCVNAGNLAEADYHYGIADNALEALSNQISPERFQAMLRFATLRGESANMPEGIVAPLESIKNLAENLTDKASMTWGAMIKQVKDQIAQIAVEEERKRQEKQQYVLPISPQKAAWKQKEKQILRESWIQSGGDPAVFESRICGPLPKSTRSIRPEPANELNEIISMCEKFGVKFDASIWKNVAKMNPEISRNGQFEIYIQALGGNLGALKGVQSHTKITPGSVQMNSGVGTKVNAEEDVLGYHDAVRLVILLAHDLKGGKWYVPVKYKNGTLCGNKNQWAAAWDFVKKHMENMPESILRSFSRKDPDNPRQAYLNICNKGDISPCRLMPRSGDPKNLEEANWATFRSRLVNSKYLTESELRLVTPGAIPRSGEGV